MENDRRRFFQFLRGVKGLFENVAVLLRVILVLFAREEIEESTTVLHGKGVRRKTGIAILSDRQRDETRGRRGPKVLDRREQDSH